ncbi:hypothetical protein T4A_2559 [Trichinella pseudospiralis]|uniref:Uncharacterized protein n=1 Tax=Trichinella pseudospiralis TaxID=6337 RepID=A0A0V1DLI1_TRIPS|nr:hypothetical protein T4A_2559 [Trichinella pseudospiralis]KRY98085.1 hypothetical protein T4C_8216 [Trichinella pseudospiralis]
MAKNFFSQYLWNKWPLKFSFTVLIHSNPESFFQISREMLN